MTTIAKQANIRTASRTAPLALLVIQAKFAAIAEVEADEFHTCPMCGHATAELFVRIDNRDNAEISVCEDCADNGDVSHCTD
jgi:ribosomal protein L37AE/L43A